MPDGHITTMTLALTTSIMTMSDGSISTSIGYAQLAYAQDPRASPTGNTTPSAVGDNKSSSSSSKLAGGIVGGIAGIVLILLAILFMVRWFRRRSRVREMNTQQNAGQENNRAMAEKTSLLTSTTGNLKKPNQLADNVVVAPIRRNDHDRPDPSGFEKIGGRKVTNPFSDNLEVGELGDIPAFPLPVGERSFSGSSRRSISNERNLQRNFDPGRVTPTEIRPSPARRPTFEVAQHHGSPVINPFESPPGTPNHQFADPARPVSPLIMTSAVDTVGSNYHYHPTQYLQYQYQTPKNNTDSTNGNSPVIGRSKTSRFSRFTEEV